MEHRLAEVVDDSVAGVVSTLKANDKVGPFGKVVDDAALSFIAPLCAHDGSNSHVSSLVSLDSWAPLL